MLIEYRLDEKIDKVQQSIDRIRFAYETSMSRGLGPLYVCFSGGKDSTVIAELAKRAGVPYELHYNITGIDPPKKLILPGQLEMSDYEQGRRNETKRWHKTKIQVGAHIIT